MQAWFHCTQPNVQSFGDLPLPAAYVLETRYMGSKILDRRTAKLESWISTDAVKGNQRVNWLLARAHAEEIRDKAIRSAVGSTDACEMRSISVLR